MENRNICKYKLGSTIKRCVTGSGKTRPLLSAAAGVSRQVVEALALQRGDENNSPFNCSASLVVLREIKPLLA